MAASPHAPFVLDHVAFGVADAARATPFLVGALGGRPFSAGPGNGFRWWQWRYAEGAVLELLEPDGPPGGFLHRFLAERGPGVHHVTFKVPELRAAARRASDAGYRVVGYDDRLPFWKECFLHPKQAQGIVVQLAETHPELEPDDPGGAPFPAAPAAERAPARVVGLQLSARDAGRARRQWGELLGGTLDAAGDGALVFRWPASALRIAVSLDAKGEEGPRAVEIADDALPSGALGDAPHPALGIPFVPAVG